MSVREIEAMAVGINETCDDTVISQSPSFIEYAVNSLDAAGVPGRDAAAIQHAPLLAVEYHPAIEVDESRQELDFAAELTIPVEA